MCVQQHTPAKKAAGSRPSLLTSVSLGFARSPPLTLTLSLSLPGQPPGRYDYNKVLKALKKEFCCNGTVVEDSELGKVIQLQGDQRKNVSDFLLGQKLCKKDQVRSPCVPVLGEGGGRACPASGERPLTPWWHMKDGAVAAVCVCAPFAADRPLSLTRACADPPFTRPSPAPFVLGPQIKIHGF